MYILEKIKKLDDKELEEYTKLRIEELEENARKINKDIDTIGYLLDYNPSAFDLLDKSEDDSLEIDLQCTYNGYIPKGTRMVYGLTYTKEKVAENAGSYYYIDTDEYIYMFLKYIKDRRVDSEHDLFVYILYFIRNYLGWFEKISRDDMFKMFYKNETTFYDPIEEHKFSWFKGMGNGMCSEIALMAQNILAFLEFNTAIVIGYEKTRENDGENHAYNLISFNDSETYELVELLIDFSNYIYVYDHNYKRIDRFPFTGELEDGVGEAIEKLRRGREKYKFKNYSYDIPGEKLFKLIKENRIDEVIKHIKPDNILSFENYYYLLLGDEVFQLTTFDNRKYSIDLIMGEKTKKLEKDMK